MRLHDFSFNSTDPKNGANDSELTYDNVLMREASGFGLVSRSRDEYQGKRVTDLCDRVASS